MKLIHRSLHVHVRHTANFSYMYMAWEAVLGPEVSHKPPSPPLESQSLDSQFVGQLVLGQLFYGVYFYSDCPFV